MGRRTRRRQRGLVPRSWRARRAFVGAGPTFLRLVARQQRARMVRRNEDGFGRLVIVGAGNDRPVLSKGWHRGLDWNAAGSLLAFVRARLRLRRSSCSPRTDRRRRRVWCGRRLRGGRAGRAAPRHVEVGEFKRARLAAACRGRDGHLGARPVLVLVHGGPTGQSLADGSPRGVVRERGCLCCSRTTGVSAATAARGCRRSPVGGVIATSPTWRPGSATRSRRAGPTYRVSRSWEAAPVA